MSYEKELMTAKVIIKSFQIILITGSDNKKLMFEPMIQMMEND
jgi:hypothetical protein